MEQNICLIGHEKSHSIGELARQEEEVSWPFFHSPPLSRISLSSPKFPSNRITSIMEWKLRSLPFVRPVPPNSFILLRHREIWYDTLFFYFFVAAYTAIRPILSCLVVELGYIKYSSSVLFEDSIFILRTTSLSYFFYLYYLIARSDFNVLQSNFTCFQISGLPIYWAHWKEKPLPRRPPFSPSLPLLCQILSIHL